MRSAARRVRKETGVSYRLLARALSRRLGVAVSHTAVCNWCAEEGDPDAARAPCECLSLLWALRQEITEGSPPSG